MITPDELRPIPVFEGLTDDQLAWIAERCEAMDLDVDDLPFAEGDPADHMYIVLHGALRIQARRNGQVVLDTFFRDGAVTGMLPYSRMTTINGRGTVAMPTRLARLHKQHFPELLRLMPVVGERLVSILANRVRDFSQLQQQREKMMALGKLSAGLAHELNNPSAAIQRDIAELEDRLEHLSCTILQICSHNLTPDVISAATELRHRFSAQTAEPLSPLKRQRHEADLSDWLEDHGVEEGNELAETFAERGVTAADLDQAAVRFPAPALPDVLTWIETHIAAEQILKDIQAASSRISELVAAVKSYSYMDQAIALQPTDVHAGIESTLTMLGHKLRKKNISVVRDYQQDLPTIQAVGGELNQIWTNLIDNAVDAMDENGELRLTTRAAGTDIFVEVIDNGSGIPSEIQSRVFEPFFTTKGVGEGSGLGLDIVKRIVEQHRGEIRLESRPGHTVFTIRLPQEAQADMDLNPVAISS
jgi:signal transduction histidine kinase